MYYTLFCILFVCLSKNYRVTSAYVDNEINVSRDTDLLLTFVIFRHGDRTPIEQLSKTMSDDPDRDIRLSVPFGPESLTNIGKYRGYQIGQYLRSRYNELISEGYFDHEVYLRSTDIGRTKMTLLTCLAAMYPPTKEQRWNPELLWQPVPFIAEPLRTDFLFFITNCDNMEFYKIFSVKDPDMAQYEDILRIVTAKTKVNLVNEPLKIFVYNDFINSQAAIGISMPVWLVPYKARLEEAAATAMRCVYKTERAKRLGGGVLMNEFFNAANRIIAGDKVDQRVRIYSAHDLNVAAQLAAARVPILNPSYGAVFSLELRRVKRTGQYIVAPVYLAQPGTTEPYLLRVESCGRLCDYDVFKHLTGNYTLTAEQQHMECSETNNTPLE